jgi:hypothetical protein
LERDFCRRRQAPQKEPEADVSKQRPEIGDYHAQNSAAKAAFLLASYQLRVSEDWVVADAVHCELVSGQFRKQQGKKQAESKVSPVKGFRAGSKIQQTSMFFE